MPKIKNYDRPASQPVQQPVRGASGADFGAGVGEAMFGAGRAGAELSATLSVLEERKRNRGDTISRVQTINEYAAGNDEEFTRIQTEEDLSKDEVVSNYNQFLKERAEKLLEEHTGTDSSRAELSAQLEAYRGQYSRSAYKASVTEQFRVMGQHMETTIANLADKAGDSPESLSTQFRGLDIEIAKMSAALTPEQEKLYEQDGRSKIAINSITRFMNMGDEESLDKADLVLNDKIVIEALEPEVLQQYKTKIAIERSRRKKEANEDQKSLDRAAWAWGVPVDKMSAQQRSAALGITMPQHQKNIFEDAGDKLALYASVRGIKVSDIPTDTALEVTGMPGPGEKANPYGTDAKANRMGLMTDLSRKMQSGTMTPDDDVIWDMNLSQWLTPIPNRDWATDEMTEYVPEIPPSIINIMKSSGRPIPPNGFHRLVTLGDKQEQAPTMGEVSTETTPDSGFVPLSALAEQVTGPLDATKEALSDITGLGGMFADTSRTTGRTQAKNTQKKMVAFLQTSPTYAQRERESLEGIVDIGPQVMGSEEKYQDKLLGMYDIVMSEAKKSEAILARENAPDLKDRPDKKSILLARRTMSSKDGLIKQFGVRRLRDAPKDPADKAKQFANDPYGTLYYTEEGTIYKKERGSQKPVYYRNQ